jgi:hypothetical protein
MQMARVPLRGVRSKDDFISKVKEAVRGVFFSIYKINIIALHDLPC